MTTYGETTSRRLYRDADRAMLGGVCAGLAGYFGLNLKVTRFLAFIAFLMAMPFAVIGYLAAVCLIPAASFRGDATVIESRCCWGRRRRRRAERRPPPPAEEPAPRNPLHDIREKSRSLDKRLAEIEKEVTSRRFQLEQEFRKL